MERYTVEFVVESLDVINHTRLLLQDLARDPKRDVLVDKEGLRALQRSVESSLIQKFTSQTRWNRFRWAVRATTAARKIQALWRQWHTRQRLKGSFARWVAWVKRQQKHQRTAMIKARKSHLRSVKKRVFSSWRKLVQEKTKQTFIEYTIGLILGHRAFQCYLGLFVEFARVVVAKHLKQNLGVVNLCRCIKEARKLAEVKVALFANQQHLSQCFSNCINMSVVLQKEPQDHARTTLMFFILRSLKCLKYAGKMQASPKFPTQIRVRSPLRIPTQLLREWCLSTDNFPGILTLTKKKLFLVVTEQPFRTIAEVQRTLHNQQMTAPTQDIYFH